MLRKLLVQIAFLESFALVGCHNAETDDSTKRLEQPVASTSQSAQHSPPAVGSATTVPDASAVATANRVPGILESQSWVLVESESIYIPVIDELGHALLAANAAAKAGRNKDGAERLRDGATYLLSLHPPDAKGKASLASAAKELNSTAKALEAGHADAKQLARTYQQAFHADITGRWLFVDVEETWQPYSRRPGLHLERALDEFKTDPRAAGTDIREANAFLQVEELRHPNGVLHRAVEELDELATQVEQGKVKDPSSIEDAIADSGHALAFTHYHVALDAWQKHDKSLASHQLKESVAHLRQAVRRATAETKAAVEALGRDAEILVSDAKADISAFAKRVEIQLKLVKSELGNHRAKPNAGK